LSSALPQTRQSRHEYASRLIGFPMSRDRPRAVDRRQVTSTTSGANKPRLTDWPPAHTAQPGTPLCRSGRISLADGDAGFQLSASQEVSVWDPSGEPALPDRACEAVFRSESLPFLTPVCICVRWKQADGSLVRSRQRVGKPRWPWKSTFAWPAYGRPEIKVIVLGCQIVIMGWKERADFSVSQAPLVAGVPRAYLGCR